MKLEINYFFILYSLTYNNRLMHFYKKKKIITYQYLELILLLVS